ncbi:MAG: AAC(3) family N-acetyltransferase [Candidatus Hermodarchaeota archaeon]
MEKVGLPNKSLCVHSSLRSFGFVEGGAKTVVSALINQNCTVVVPTFSYDFDVPPPKHIKLPVQNAYTYTPKEGIGKIYTPASNEIHSSMGVIPKYILSISGRVRGNHPLSSFTAIGSKAEEIIGKQTPDNVYAPLAEVCNDDGLLVLMGVNLTKATAVHYAEELAGRRMFIRWANDVFGNPIAVKIGGCSHGFNNLSRFVEPIEKNITVGNSLWRIFPLRSFVDIVAQTIQENPNITHCYNPDCEDCKDAIQGGPYYLP